MAELCQRMRKEKGARHKEDTPDRFMMKGKHQARPEGLDQSPMDRNSCGKRCARRDAGKACGRGGGGSPRKSVVGEESGGAEGGVAPSKGSARRGSGPGQGG